jgi:methionine synthase II (cobalamin-independent)
VFWGTFFPGLEGFEEIKNPEISIFRTYLPDVAAFVESNYKPGESVLCTGKIKHVGSTYIEQWEFLKNRVPKEEVRNCKITLAAPNWYHLRYREGVAYPKSVYANDQEYFADIAKAYQEELQILYDHGVRNVQFDDPNIACPFFLSFLAKHSLNAGIDFCSESMLEGWAKDPKNTKTAEQVLDQYIQLYNDCIAKRPADMHVGIHVCRGNFVNSRHFSEGGYDRVARQFFNNLNANTYYLEYDTPRAGGFEPLKELPEHKNVILGIVTSKFPKLEDKEEMKRRVRQAAEIVASGSGQSPEEAIKRLGISPQCGFASHSSGNAIDRQGMENKLQLVREIANDLWPGEP